MHDELKLEGLVAKIDAIQDGVDAFNPDMRRCGRSILEAEEKFWNLRHEIRDALTARTLPPANTEADVERVALFRATLIENLVRGTPLDISYADAGDAVDAALSETAIHVPAPSLTRPAGGEEVEKLVGPWADYHGDLPDYDHPMRCVFESGIQYAVELLAKELCVEDWTPCDGTEEFDGDLGGTLMNIVLAAMPKDEHGDPLHPRDLVAALTKPPALPKEGEGLTEGAVLAWMRRTGRTSIALIEDVDAHIAALATPQQVKEGDRHDR